jgi:asparagine synthase (glutamine-hydrolysing)
VCGIVGVITALGNACAWSHEEVARARDQLAHRGPDGAGLWPARDGTTPHALLGHRRLSIVDRSPAGAQPCVVRDRQGIAGVLIYNGELYNAGELRAQLAVQPSSHHAPRSDTWALAHHLAAHGADALSSLRGMFAFAWLDVRRDELLLARDPLGIKPLLYCELAGGQGTQHAHLLLASELPALVSLREKVLPTLPDRAVVSAYMSTIRTTLGERTLLQGVRTLLPGEARQYALRGQLTLRRAWEPWRAPRRERHASTPDSLEAAAARVGEVVRESIVLHAEADAPVCTMLSGGLDSTIIATELLRRGHAAGQHTYCARVEDDAAQHAGDAGPAMQDADYARRLASQLGTRHREASLDADGFLVRWSAMVQALGTPLSTPNEAAIFEVLRAAGEDGHRVALSGEGADELFGGYTLVLAGLLHALADAAALDARGHARLALESGAWMGEAIKPQVLQASAWRDLGEDHALHAWASSTFADLLALDDAAPHDQPQHALGTHLRWQRRVNLAGLLHRLDTASMLVGIEGRTPFADLRVLELAESLPMHLHARLQVGGGVGKLLLRSAFAGQVPRETLQRSKASFPLPFQRWMAPLAPLVLESDLLRELVREPVLALVASRPAEHWNLAWPLINLALWEQRWWGRAPAQAAYSARSHEAALAGHSPTQMG